MRKLMLKKGRSFRMKNFSCINGTPFLVDDETGTELMATGRFNDLGTVTTADEPELDTSFDGSQIQEEPKELTAEIIEKMKKDDLVTLAEEKSIDIKDCSNNEERIERIKGALGLVNLRDLGFEG